MNIQRYYEILEVDPQASPEVLRQAYEDLLEAWDPEGFSKNPDLKRRAEKKIEEIREAYRQIVILSSRNEKTDANATGTKEKIVRARQKSRHDYLPIHPWMRFSARFFDYLFFTLVLHITGFFHIPVLDYVPSFFLPVILTFIWVFLESLLIHLFGTTPGKWMLTIELIDKSLKRPGYWNALLRSLSVWCNGLGTGFFLIAPVTLVVSYVRLRRQRVAPWDRMGKFRMIHGKMENRKLLTAGFAALMVFLLAVQFRGKDAVSTRVADPRPGTGNGDPVSSEPLPLPAASRTPLSQANRHLMTGRYEEAIKGYRSIIMKNPNSAEARYGLGVSYAKVHRDRAAKEELKEAIRLSPDYAEAHHILGLMHLTTGDKEAALKHYGILLHLDQKLAEELKTYIDNMDSFVIKERAPSR